MANTEYPNLPVRSHTSSGPSAKPAPVRSAPMWLALLVILAAPIGVASAILDGPISWVLRVALLALVVTYVRDRIRAGREAGR